MATARAQLHLVEPTDVAFVPVALGLLEDAVDSATSIADDLLAAVDAAEHRVWADSRAGALSELGRMAVRIETFRDAFAALDPRPTDPPRPTRVA